MRKWFDKYLAQSSKGQMCALIVAFILLILAGAAVGMFVLEKDNPDSAKFGYRGMWGLMQCVDGGFVDATISSNTKMVSTPDGEKISENAPIIVVFLSLGFWVGGMILISFFTGAATNFLDARQEKILKGNVNYSFKKKYILIVGYDFQTKNLIRHLLKENSSSKLSIVLVTDLSVEDISNSLLPDLQPSDIRRLFMMRKDITQDSSYKDFLIIGAKEIYIIGDGDTIGRDGKTLQALDTLFHATKRELGPMAPNTTERQIKVYLHIEDSVLYSNIRAIKLTMDELKIFDLEVFNYYESWAWECWSNKSATDDGKSSYLPIRHAEGTEHAELFFIGAGRMGRAMINFAMPLMNYGGSGKNGRITVFDLDESKKSFLPDKEVLDALPELEVEFRQMDGCSDEANAIMLEAARRKDTSVTIVIAISDPAAAIRAYAALSNSLCRESISVLVWQATDSGCVPDKSYLRMGGIDSIADKRKLRYFGMTDRLPWKNPARFDYGMAANYYYSCWYPNPDKKEPPVSPNATASDFVERAKKLWNPEEARTQWSIDRWKKWSSVNCGDSFREKSILFKGMPYAEAAAKILKAEHNRWWTEKLLAGWLPSGQNEKNGSSNADKKNMMHGDMIPFEDLSESVKDKDKIVIAAMTAFGFC